MTYYTIQNISNSLGVASTIEQAIGMIIGAVLGIIVLKIIFNFI